jgi:hypothetical protein
LPLRARAIAVAVALPLAGAALAQAAPPSGRYAGELCVATGDAPADCGAVDVTLRGRGRVAVRIADLVYRLTLHSSQLDLVLVHGTVQIDAFTAAYEWQGRTLHFSDPDKPVRYRVRIDAPVAR